MNRGRSKKLPPQRQPESPQQLRECVLLIATGTTPAVLTETIWGLAQETPPVVPNRIVVITTVAGQQILERELLQEPSSGEPPIWQQLRSAVADRHPASAGRLFLELPARIITEADPRQGTTYPLEDIRTPQDQEAAADFLLREVQNLTKENDPPLIVSMSGGRKTMGALLYAAMIFQGREDDRLTHVLIPAEYESTSLRPKFYFPEQRPGLHAVPGLALQLQSRGAKIDLADVPFPRMRYLFGKDYESLPKKFTDIVRAASREVKKLAQVEFALEKESWTIRVRGRQVRLKGREVPFFDFLCTRLQEGHPPFEYHGAAETEFKKFLEKWCVARSLDAAKHRVSGWKANVNPEDFRKLLSSLRTRFRKSGLSAEAERLFPQRGLLGFSPDIVRILQEGA